MTGLTSTFPFTPLLSRPRPNSFSPPLAYFSSFQSHQWDLHHLLFPPSLSKSQTSLPSSTFSIFARYGAGGSPPRSRADDFDQALDISAIKSDTVRLIDQRQNMVGLVSKSEAIRMADDAELDLVILSPDADPPVIRIMDYNKYRYEQQRKKKAQQKKSAAGRMDLKELKMGYNIDVHDYAVRLRAAQKFLKDGDKVKVIVNLKGRESEFRNNAIELIRRFQNDIGELATEETRNFRDRNMFIILVPNKANIAQKSEEPPPKNKEEMTSQVSNVL